MESIALLLSIVMAKRKAIRAGVPGYSKPSPNMILMHKCYTVDTSWMDNLPGGTWQDEGVLKSYLNNQWKENNVKEPTVNSQSANDEATSGDGECDPDFGSTGSLF